MRDATPFLLLTLVVLLPGISLAGCPALLAVSPEVEQYALGISTGFEAELSIESKIRRIIEYIHGENGLRTKNLSPARFFELHDAISGKNVTRLGQIQELAGFKNLDDKTLGAYAQLYNKYMVPDARGIVFAPTASDIVGHRMAFGCTHYARTFIAIAKALKLFKPGDMRYVVAASYKDYNKACPGKGSAQGGTETINGHQFVLLRYDGRWWFVNTSNKRFEKVPAGGLGYRKQNLTVQFPSYAAKSGSGHNILLVRYIGGDYNDGACDNSFGGLMNISVSGTADSNACLWPKYDTIAK